MADRTVEGVKLDLPSDFAVEEVKYIFAAPPPKGAVSMSSGKPMGFVRPNLIMHRRVIDPKSNIQEVGERTSAELMTSIPQMVDVQRSDFVFEDKVVGKMMAFSFEAAPGATIRQFHVVRLDAGWLTTLTLTLDASRAKELTDQYLKMLARARCQ